MEPIFFTVINPNTEEETRMNIEMNDGNFDINGVLIDTQQLAELGMLFFALANQHGKPDLDSCGELLDGYKIPVPVQALLQVGMNA